ncbi:alpha/beta fold hydrolase [Jiangella alkaliphila]|uniref:Pimeloyl-ACP methyl ester carboxylesterase n=1 Tax=Jiangella alkaliphila TaxID=419479 RepID=A0A1H2LGP2_9ACTN|nr:alpha/beta hydrolase [Jiangella alkaliphila]SDU80200.1 Pimeloyl-ACP methyl ester carboxylesterase [Jiangella alkaliphila]
METHEEFTWRGRRVQWSRRGSGPPVVFCHGTPWSSALWAPFADALSSQYTVHLWDMPGYGRSSKDDAHDVSLAAQGELLADLLRHWGGPPPHLLTHDIGGAVALRALLLHGAPVASLALVDVVALAPWGSPFFRLVGENAEVFQALPAALHEALLRAYVSGAASSELTASELNMLVTPWLGPEGQRAFYRQIAAADQTHTDEIELLYPTVGVPTLVAWGTGDTWIPVDRGHRLASLIPGARLELFEGAGHLVQLDAPVALTASLQRWLDSVSR